MVQVVLDSKDLVKTLETGEHVTPAEVTADNARQRGEKPEEKKAEVKTQEGEKPKELDDQTEDENGLTAKDRAELTEKMQRAIGKKHRQLKDAEEFAASQYSDKRLAENRISQLEQELAALKEQAQATKPAQDDKPKRESFETEEAYRDAVDDWRVDQKFKARQAEEAKKAAQERYQAIVEAATARIEKAKELVPDFEEVVGENETRVPPAVANYMQESEMIGELTYHFAKNPEVLERVSRLTPARQLVEIGKIESKLEPFVKGQPETKAPNGAKPSQNDDKSSTETDTRPSETRAPVIKPITSGSATQVDKSADEKNVRDLIADWKKRSGTDLLRRKRH